MIFLCWLGVGVCELEVMYQWGTFKFDAPYNYPRQEEYVPETALVNSIEIGWDRIFLTTPRIWSGNLASLAWIPRNKPGLPGDISPPLQAYPSWDWHVGAVTGTVGNGNCTGLVSVFRARADRCNRLWVLDSGVLDSLVAFNVVCPPKILIFDMRNDQLVRSITLPEEVLRRNSLLSNLVLDDKTNNFHPGGFGSCDNMFVYISDTTAPGIIVYDAGKDAAWRVSHPYMFPVPDFGKFSLAGESFTLMDGILGMAVTPPGSFQRKLYFQAFASDRIYSIPTSVLQRGPNPGDDSDLPVTLVGTKSSQAAGLTVDPKDGALIFCPVSETAIASWVPGSPDHRVLAYNPELLQFALDFRPADRDNGNVWLVTTRLQKFFRRTINSNDVNLRIMRLVEPQNYFNNTLFLYKRK